MIVDFLVTFKDYLIDVLPFLAVGFFLSGVVNEYIPAGWVERHLGGKGLRPLIYSTIVGTILPICCIGSLPVAISLYQKGARLGPVLAFLVATPATSISALLVCYALLGLKFTIYIFFAVIIMGLVMGIIGSFQVFTASFIMTGGGPQNATLFMVLKLYFEGFRDFRMGYAATLAWLLFGIIMFFTAIQFRIGNRWVYYEGKV